MNPMPTAVSTELRPPNLLQPFAPPATESVWLRPILNMYQGEVYVSAEGDPPMTFMKLLAGP